MCENSHDFICENSPVNFHIISYVKSHEFTCENSPVNFHIISYVKITLFHM